jgi:arginine decarboxylase
LAWTHRESEQLYNVREWGRDYFRINAKGNVECTPNGPGGDETTAGPSIDLHELIGSLQQRGVELPILLRFDGVLRSRVRELRNAFDRARAEFGYEAPYQCVYPIKVNQQRHVVEVLLQAGSNGDVDAVGLEVGSKPELLAALALLSGRRSIIVCNGYKDRDYVETAMLSSKLGLRPILVVEKASEIDPIIAATKSLGIRPSIGVRTRLAGRGAGRWRESAGDRSKFGLSVREIVEVVDRMREHDMLDCIDLLHFHLGSQMTNIRSLKAALQESVRTFVGLHELGAEIKYFDVGGGLGIDYDGSRTNFESSKNYSLQEYAGDVVYHIFHACDEAGLPHPTILSESGRALTAHHAVLVTEALGVSSFAAVEPPPRIDDGSPIVLADLTEVLESVSVKNYQECYHDALAMREQSLTLFQVGQLTLPERAIADELFWRTCHKILAITRELDYVPDDLAGLERDLADTYYLNFSVFQSMPDSWAIGQLFPVLPLHRHGEKPERSATLADITCDSDGKVDRFIALRNVKRTLELHAPRAGEPYHVGFFLVGAYQEILGDMHNLFGDTNAVHVDVHDDGRVRLSNIVRGDRVQDVLSYVQYFEQDLLASLRRSIEQAIEEDRITFEESAALIRRYESGLRGYTYLARRQDERPS